jgi:hypothetical protein
VLQKGEDVRIRFSTKNKGNRFLTTALFAGAVVFCVS